MPLARTMCWPRCLRPRNKATRFSGVTIFSWALRMGQEVLPEAEEPMASRSSARETVAVPRFMTTKPPAILARCAASRGVAPLVRPNV